MVSPKKFLWDFVAILGNWHIESGNFNYISYDINFRTSLNKFVFVWLKLHCFIWLSVEVQRSPRFKGHSGSKVTITTAIAWIQSLVLRASRWTLNWMRSAGQRARLAPRSREEKLLHQTRGFKKKSKLKLVCVCVCKFVLCVWMCGCV